MKHLKYLLVALGLLVSSQADAGTIYVNTGGSATYSGSTEGTSIVTGSLITCATTTCTITDASTNLGTVNTSGANQTSINIAGATNTNRTIFWITGVTSGCIGLAVNCVFTVDTAPTGSGSFTGWAVNGQYVWPSGSTIDKAANALRPGDTLQFDNTPATKSSQPYINTAAAGDATTGKINLIGKAGVRPVLQMTSNVAPINATGIDWFISNLEITTSVASATSPLVVLASGSQMDNCYVHASGGAAGQHGVTASASGIVVTNSEIAGMGGSGISSTTGIVLFSGNYIHGNAVDGITSSQAGNNNQIVDNVISGNTGRGVYASGAAAAQTSTMTVYGNTFYANATSGFEVANANTTAVLRNNIFVNDGTHANVVYPAAGAISTFHAFTYVASCGSQSG